MKRFNNKYRIPSARLPNYDYSKNGNYFITICTLGRMRYFGTIKNDEVILSDVGIIINDLIPKMIKQFPDIRIVEHIIMPDHIHFIIKINKSNIDISINNELSVETRLIASLQSQNQSGGITGINNPMFKNGIPKIIRWFKGRATFEIRKTNKDFAWQTRYYDRVIRNDKEYFAMMQYIKSNPEKWDND